MEESAADKKKAHRERHSGRKAEKKKSKNEHVQELTDKQRNPKAFTFNSAVKAERRFRRTKDIETKKHRVPVVDRTPVEPPPIMVVVVGPPKVGKTTLIQCLIKSFTRQPLTTLKGPLTVVSGKKRRITLMECNNDINSMIDLAKVADLVLLLIDASFGFEMEIFEFLNICQVHGMPKIMGVLTHLDMLKHAKTLKRTKKVLKHRFWTEVYPGAKLFYLSGILHGEYLRNEVKNLARYIAVMKFRPITWQTTHSYLVADRMEDLTPPEIIRQNPKADRTVSLYGFVRGIPLNKTSCVHIPGCGDSKISDVCFLPDPCPLPQKLKKRSLVDKERLIYAPFSGVGGIVYDKDAVYIELAGSHSHHQQVGGRDESEREMVASLLETKDTLDAKMARSQLQIFSGAAPITAQDFETTSFKENTTNGESRVKNPEDGRKRRKAVFEVEDDDLEIKSESEDDDMNLRVVTDDGYEDVEIKSESDEDDQYNEKKSTEYDINNSEIKSEDDDVEIKSESDSDSEYSGNVLSKKVKSKQHSQIKRKVRSKADVSDEECSDSSDEDKNPSKPQVKAKNDKIKEKCVKVKSKKDTTKLLAKSNKRKSTKGNVGVDSASDYDEDSGNINKKKKNVHGEEKKENEVRYHASQSQKDKDIQSKISEALESFKSKTVKEKTPLSVTDSAFSDEESSDTTRAVSQPDSSEEDTSGDEVKSEEDSGEDEESAGDESSSNKEDDDPTAVNWKTNLAQKAADAFIERQNSKANLWKLVYGQDDAEQQQEDEDADDEEEVAGLFRIVGKKQEKKIQEKDSLNTMDESKFPVTQFRDWSSKEVRDTIKDCFVTGKWKKSEDASELLRLDDMSDADDEVYGEFEDYETGEKHGDKDEKKKGKKEPESDGEEGNDKDKKPEKPLTKAELIAKKRKLKEQFDAEYDEKDGDESAFFDDLKKEATKQAELNRSQFEDMDDAMRVQLEGYRAGMYVRVELQDIPCELVTNFDPTYPLILGCLQPREENVGYLRVRIKKHRWYPKILKTRDPLIISLGWRRFQTLAVYSKLEDNMRHRMLKYTPEHVVCTSHFWGPITRPSTGFLAVQDVATKQAGFRIVATGSVLYCNKSTDVTKKLKLTGYPLKIYKKTAFIKGMFTSQLEVAKFEGARIKTVSGIRGIIKKAVNKPEGAFRATFEDKIQLSDIVFCRTWYSVEIPKFYNPLTSLLLPPEQKNSWRGMKTVGHIKRERGIRADPQKDSLYTPIVREKVSFKPLVIPKKLQQNLPYKDKPKVLAMQKKKEKVAVVRDHHESKVAAMMKKLKTIYSEKTEVDRKAKVLRLKQLRKRIETEEARKMQKQRTMKKELFRSLSKSQAKKPKF